MYLISIKVDILRMQMKNIFLTTHIVVGKLNTANKVKDKELTVFIKNLSHDKQCSNYCVII